MNERKNCKTANKRTSKVYRLNNYERITLSTLLTQTLNGNQYKPCELEIEFLKQVLKKII